MVQHKHAAGRMVMMTSDQDALKAGGAAAAVGAAVGAFPPPAQRCAAASV